MVKGATRVEPLAYTFVRGNRSKRHRAERKETNTAVDIAIALLDVITEIFKWLQLPGVVAMIKNMFTHIRQVLFAS